MRQQVAYRFVFAISLEPRAVSHCWETVEVNLRRTIRSIRATQDASPLIVIACHDKPDLGTEDGQDLHVLIVPFAPETDVLSGAADKLRKRRFIGAWLRDNLPTDDFYVMFLDADDLIHKRVVAYVLGDDNRRSYLIDKGYRYDFRTGLVDRKANFHQICGSCFIGYFRREELPCSWDDVDSVYGRFDDHVKFENVATAVNKAADPIPFNAVVYTMNHGESLRSKKNRGRVWELSLRNLLWPSYANAILAQDFSSPDLASADLSPGSIAVLAGVLLAWSYRKLLAKFLRYAQTRTIRKPLVRTGHWTNEG